MKKRQILIVEPNLDGHHAFYLSLIVKALQGNHLTLLTQKDTSALNEHFDQREIEKDAIAIVHAAAGKQAEIYKQACGLTRDQHFDQIFIPYLDHYLPIMLEESDQLNAPVSGIWFHPHALDAYYRWMPPFDKRQRERGRINRRLRMKKKAQGLQHVFFLDPEAPIRLKKINPAITSSVLPDPGERKPCLSQTEARERFNLPQNKTIFLHAGSPEKRKGLPDLISAFCKLSRDKQWSEQACLLRIGSNDRLSTKVNKQLQLLTDLKLAIVSNQFVSSSDFIEYFAAADCVVIPYRKFRFSSGILANATMAKRPVICSNYGLIAKTVKTNKIGTCYRHGSTRALAKSLREFTPHKIDISTSRTAEEFIQTFSNTVFNSSSHENITHIE